MTSNYFFRKNRKCKIAILSGIVVLMGVIVANINKDITFFCGIGSLLLIVLLAIAFSNEI